MVDKVKDETVYLLLVKPLNDESMWLKDGVASKRWYTRNKTKAFQKAFTHLDQCSGHKEPLDYVEVTTFVNNMPQRAYRVKITN